MADRSVGIKVTGAKELRRALKQAENHDLDAELKQAYRDAEDVVVADSKIRAPFDSGDLRSTIRGTKGGKSAQVVIGKGKVNDYAGVIIFPNNRGITPNPFPYDVLKSDWQKIHGIFVDAVDRVTRKI